MLEVYGFLAMFAAQVILLSVAYPKGLVGRVRAQLARYPAERFPQLYPGGTAQIERQLRIYQALNAVIAAAGSRCWSGSSRIYGSRFGTTGPSKRCSVSSSCFSWLRCCFSCGPRLACRCASEARCEINRERPC